MLSQEFIEARKQQLLTMLSQLQAQMQATPTHTELSEDGDDVDAAVHEVEIDSVNQAEDSIFQKDIDAINRALARIDNGTYGFVINDLGNVTTTPIPPERLEVYPHAETLATE